MAGDLRSCAINQQNAAFQIDGKQAAAHGLDDVVVEGLQILQRLAFSLEFDALGRIVCASKLPRYATAKNAKRLLPSQDSRARGLGVEIAVCGMIP